MKNQQSLADVARTIIDSNMYMVLGTADKTGQPWVSPVYYASFGNNEFYWVSSPDAKHSLNLKTRPKISIVIFNSQAPIGTSQAVYISAVVEELAGSDLDKGIEIFTRSSLEHGGSEWKIEDTRAPALYRLYRATALKYWVLKPGGHPDRRVQVDL